MTSIKMDISSGVFSGKEEFPIKVKFSSITYYPQKTHSQNVKLGKELKKRGLNITPHKLYTNWFSMEMVNLDLQGALISAIVKADKSLDDIYNQHQEIYDKGIVLTVNDLLFHVLENSNTDSVSVNMQIFAEFVNMNKPWVVHDLEDCLDKVELAWERSDVYEDCEIDKGILVQAREELKKYTD